MARMRGPAILLLAGAVGAGPALAATEAEEASICMNDATRFRQWVEASWLPPAQQQVADRFLLEARDHAQGGDVQACRDAIDRAQQQVALAREGEVPGGPGAEGALPQNSAEIPEASRPAGSRGVTTGPSATPAARQGGLPPQNTVKADVGALVESSAVTQVEGIEVAIAGGENIGEVERVVQTRDGQRTFLVVAVGGFLGIGDREIALPLEDFEAGDGRFMLPGYDRAAIDGRDEYEEGRYREVDLSNVLEGTEVEGSERGEGPPFVPKQ